MNSAYENFVEYVMSSEFVPYEGLTRKKLLSDRLYDTYEEDDKFFFSIERHFPLDCDYDPGMGMSMSNRLNIPTKYYFDASLNEFYTIFYEEVKIVFEIQSWIASCLGGQDWSMKYDDCFILTNFLSGEEYRANTLDELLKIFSDGLLLDIDFSIDQISTKIQEYIADCDQYVEDMKKQINENINYVIQEARSIILHTCENIDCDNEEDFEKIEALIDSFRLQRN